MDWNQLLNSERMRVSTRIEGDSRSAFESDYDRIIYCSAFRRLQDKAQVFPLEKYDYVRTRLTHSLEVASLGRSFGKDVAEKLEIRKEKYFVDNPCVKYDIAHLVSSACLVHDVGNPPFGHFGETAIQSWFSKFLSTEKYQGKLKPEQEIDFLKFEGNAQSLRILSRLQFLIDENGLNLTYATLSSMLKYPRKSTEVYEFEGSKVKNIFDDKTLKHKVSYKKHGCFQSEVNVLSKVKESTGIKESRHPLAFLVEAADDIANSAADIEDAYKKKAISYQLIIDKFNENLGGGNLVVSTMNKYFKESQKLSYTEPEAITIQRLRAHLQGKMLRSCVDVFVDNYDNIMNGSFDSDLISRTKDDSKEIYKTLLEIAKERIYNNNDVIMLELVGSRVIDGLLNIFAPAILSEQCNNIKSELGKYYSIISPNFRFVIENYSDKDLYSKLQLASDFICGMTDSFALDLYQKLSGCKLF